jgi:transcriptional regulator GlxA family with amidase domain
MNPRSQIVSVKSSDLVVKRFEQVVERNFHDRRFSLTQMAAGMDMSERQLQRKLRLSTGKTPTEIVRTFRLSRSLEYLLTGASIRDTARAVGFSSQAYFSSCFRAEYGRTPSEYRDHRNILI